jgi:hypothetical protein
MNGKRTYAYVMFLIFNCFLSCSNNEYKQLRNGNIVSSDNIEYVFLAHERKYIILGERSFVSHIKWQSRKFQHLNGNINAGVYSCNHDPNLAILFRIKYNSEWSDIYIKKELSENNYSIEDCNSFKNFDIKRTISGYHRDENSYFETDFGIKNDIDVKNFIEELIKNEIFNLEDYNYSRTLFDERTNDNRFIGYVYGLFQDIPYLALPGEIWINNDRLYYLVMDNRLFNISIDWLKKLGYIE